MMTRELPVNEIFYSLQGEGGQSGRAMIFIRLSGCNLRCSYCDTDFDDRMMMTPEDILSEIVQYPSREILWTGGEPTLFLTDDTVDFFHRAGYRQSVETNGTRSVPQGIDYITCSPKPEAIKGLRGRFIHGVQEIRWPLQLHGELPPSLADLPQADRYFVSPVEEEGVSPSDAVQRCVSYVLAHPEWELSVQLHKVLGFK